jgi:SAM-dependent methyltransferase
VDDREIEKATSLEDSHWWYAARRKLLHARFADVAPGIVLDVGAAGGGNGRVLRDLGWQVVAAEYSDFGLSVARSRGLSAIRADARRLPIRDSRVDAVIAMDVLEHIDDDRAAASEIARVLRPGGIAFITVPADPALWSAHDVALSHVRRYTRDSLLAVIDDAGLQVAEIRSWNVLLRPAVVMRRRLNRSAEGTDSEMAPVHPLLNRGLAGVTAIEERLPWLRRRRGVSLVLTAVAPGPA